MISVTGAHNDNDPILPFKKHTKDNNFIVVPASAQPSFGRVLL